MTTLRHFPLGSGCPDSPHAVCSSLPTVADVRGYEEKDPRVMAALRSGYPRFLVHPWVRELTHVYAEEAGVPGGSGFLIPSGSAVRCLEEHLGRDCRTDEVAEGLFLVSPGEADDAAERLDRYVRHLGCGLSSREAEDRLLALGRHSTRFAEDGFEDGDAEDAVVGRLAELCGSRREDVRLCASGMSAFYSGFRAVRDLQRERGRTEWIQVGWLYLDSGCILREFRSEGENLRYCYDAGDTEAILGAIAEAGPALAGLVVECPTNPLAKVCDLARISEAVRARGGILIADPTIASVYNVDVLPYADILVTSLTKYAAHEGDVMIGARALNRNSPFYSGLAERCERYHFSPYQRDRARLAREMQTAPEIVEKMNENARRLAEFFAEHPKVRAVHRAAPGLHADEVFKKGAVGGAIVTIELKGDTAGFYDHVPALKGPSFGTSFTLVSLFMYLAHYDLVTTSGGRQFLGEVGLDPELMRISVGAEPIDDLTTAFGEALRHAAER